MYDSQSINPVFAQERSEFMNKVLALVGLSLLLTGLGVYLGFHYFLPIFAKNPMLMFAVYGVELLMIFTSAWWRKIEPWNYLLFGSFTFLSGLTLVPILAQFIAEFGSYDVIYRALFSTTVTFIAMSALGHGIKKNLAGWSGLLTVGLVGLLIVGIMGIFFPWGNTGEMLFGAAGVILFSAYTMFEMNALKNYPTDESIAAAMGIYLNIFNLFIFMLRLVGATSRD